MNPRMLVTAAAAVLMLAGGAFAASPPSHDYAARPQLAAAKTPAEQCTALEKQFDAAIVKHATAAKAADAKTLRQEASTLCTTGKAPDGVKKLEQAFKDIGVKPVM